MTRTREENAADAIHEADSHAVELAYRHFRSMKPCPTEDAANCAWHAVERGNGYGVSFIDIGGTTVYQRP